MPAVRDDIKAGRIYPDIPNEAYHAGPGISKSGLWKIHNSTPAHYKFEVRKEKAHFDFGEAAHLAILEPDAFEKIVYRGPDDRRGSKWKDAQEYCAITQVDHRGAKQPMLLLTAGDYDKVLAIRDGVHADAWINGIITGGDRMVEASGYWIDPETDVLCRCRPDLYRRDLSLIVDVKSTTDASPRQFAKSVVNYGYHAQEPFYSDGWRACGETVDAFVFIAWEKESPFAKVVYELPPSIVEEGRAIIRKTLPVYAECERTGEWPGYADGVQELEFPRWAYTEIDAPGVLDMEAAE